MKFFNWKSSVILCTFSLASGATILAAELPTQLPAAAQDLRAATELAWKLNPQAAALDARDIEARAGQDLAGKLTPEPGSVSIGSRNDRYNRDLGQQEYEAEVATPLWLPGQRSARMVEAASRKDEANARRIALHWEIAGEVREAWWNLASARNAHALAQRRLETARALETDVRRRYTVGDLAKIDANLALTEVNGAQSDSIETAANLSQAEQVFRLLTGVAAPSSMAAEPLTHIRSAKELFDAPQLHPLIARQASIVRSARTRVTVEQQSQRAAPELALRMVRERGAGDQPFANSVGIRLKIPFSSGAQVRQTSAAAQATALEAEAEMQRIKARVELQLKQLLQLQQSADQQVIHAEQSHELSAENLGLAEKSFKLGENDLTTLLRIRAAALNAESFLDRQRIARSALTSRLNQALGVLP